MDETTPVHWMSDEALQLFSDDIVACMVIYGHWNEDDARRRLDDSGLCAPENNVTTSHRSLLFHEYPYYYALAFTYGSTLPPWHNDPALWPPPEEYLDRHWKSDIITFN